MGYVRGKQEVAKFCKSLGNTSIEDRELRHNLRVIDFRFNVPDKVFSTSVKFETVELSLDSVKKVIEVTLNKYLSLLEEKQVQWLSSDFEEAMKGELECSEDIEDISQIFGRIVILTQFRDIDDRIKAVFHSLADLSALYFNKNSKIQEMVFAKTEKVLEKKFIKFLKRDDLTIDEIYIAAMFFREKMAIYAKKIKETL